MIRTYKELSRLTTFEERYEYLKLGGSIGVETFGFDAIFRHRFLKSKEWLRARDYVISRDCGCDLGIKGHDIRGQRIIVHHMNPISLEDIEKATDILLDPNYLVTTIQNTHLAIHYGDKKLLVTAPIERRMNDTCPWKH